MFRYMRRHVTFSNVVSLMALFLALGGSSYAVSQISGSQIKDRSIAGTKLKRNTVDGRVVRESRLGKVPRARRADNARRLQGLTPGRLRVSCPEATRRVSGVCVELAPRPAALYTGARVQCESAGRRLPSHQELVGLVDDADVALAPEGELTGHVYPSGSDPGNVDVMVVASETGRVALTPDTFAGSKPFRCVAYPAN